MPASVSSEKQDPEFLAALEAASSLHGIEPEYWDLWGRRRQTPPSTAAALLAALGVPAGDAASLEGYLERSKGRYWTTLADPALVVSASQHAPTLILRTPFGAKTISLAFYWEDGRAERRDIDLAAMPPAGEYETGGRRYTRYEAPLPVPLPLGYHDVEVVLPGPPRVSANTRLIVAPDQAWLPGRLEQGGRLAGLAVSLYGIRSDHNWGVGDFTDLKRLLGWAARELGVAFVALNPLHAIGNRQPYNTSPYLPETCFYRNFLYLDVEAIEEFEDSPAARRLAASPRVRQEIDSLRASEAVEYERTAWLKLRFLKLLFRHFERSRSASDPQRRAFQSWTAAEGALLQTYSTWCALDEVLHKGDRNVWIWPGWPEEYRTPDSPAVRDFARAHPRLIRFYQWTLWQVDRQAGAAQRHAADLGMPVGLYHDLALAVDRCGADMWAYRRFFVQGCRVGSPPDDFAPEGQDWSFPPPNLAAHREDGYRLFAETIRRNARHGGALRLDHVMRFFRLFCIPDGLPARDGAYVRQTWEDFIRILALESQRGRFLVVGEDLGTVPPGMRETLERFRVLSYRLFYFERDHEGALIAPERYPLHALVSSTTHDLPTLAGFWAGRDLETRRACGLLEDPALLLRQKEDRQRDKLRMLEALSRAGLLPKDIGPEAACWDELTGEIHNAIIGYLVSTPSQLMVLNQEDLTKELDQQNVPGSTWQYPNWRRKMRFSLEELEHGRETRDFAAMFRAWLEKTGRL